jgi:hypothetical protein
VSNEGPFVLTLEPTDKQYVGDH